eukprot:gene17394-biopygen12810
MQVLRPGVREHAAQALLTIASGPPPPLADEVLAAIAAVVHSERNRYTMESGGKLAGRAPRAARPPVSFLQTPWPAASSHSRLPEPPGPSRAIPPVSHLQTPLGVPSLHPGLLLGHPASFLRTTFPGPAKMGQGYDGPDACAWPGPGESSPGESCAGSGQRSLLLGFHTRLLWRRLPQHPDPASCFYVNPAPVFYELLSASVISRFLTVRARPLRRGAPRSRRARGAEQAAADALDTGGDADGARAAADPLRPRLAAVRPSGIAGGASVTASFLLPLFVASRAPGAPAPVASPPNPAAAERGSAE